MSRDSDQDLAIGEDAEAFLLEVLDGLDLAVAVLDRDLAVRCWNRGMARLTGHRLAALRGERLTARFRDLDAPWFHGLVDEAQTFGEARSFPLATGRRLLVGLGADAAAQAGRLLGCRLARVGSGLAHDASLCLALRLGDPALPAPAVDLDQARDALLVSLGHQLRTPLNSMMGFVELVLMGRYGPVQDRQAELLRKALQSSRRMARTVDLLVKLSGIDMQAIEAAPQAVPLAGLVAAARREVLELAAETAVEIETETAPAEATAQLDPARTAEALIEVLRNAVQASPHGGRVLLRASLSRAAASFRVVDEGPGIAAEEQGRIFARYYSGAAARADERGGGLGLGLAYARACVLMQGGHIEVQSAPGCGATFLIILPQGPRA
jgi:signal transduction histidine kinase